MSPLTGSMGMSTPGAMARMTQGGFKPKQTPARLQYNAARGRDGLTPTPAAQAAVGAVADLALSERVRKERSSSTTPGPGTLGSSTVDATKRIRV